MEAAAHSHHDHAPMPTSGTALNAVAFSATLHCLTGCAIGEVTGMIIGTEFPSDGRYGLFLQFKHQGKVHTAAFTGEAAR